MASVPLHVLLVEDSHLDAELVLHALAEAGYAVSAKRVQTAEDLHEALKDSRWQLVLSDYTLPALQAPDVLKAVAATGRDLPCIVVSGTIGEENAVGVLKSGAVDFLLKHQLTRLGPAISRELKEADGRRRRREVEDALRQTEGSFRALFAGNPLPMWVYDLETLAFLAVNDAAVASYGYSHAEFLAMQITDVRPEEDRQKVIDHVRSGRVAFEHSGQWRHRVKDGQIREVEIHSHTMEWSGRPSCLVVVHDVTERRRLEQQVRQAQKMDAVGRLAGGIAHDFNNLLTTILGYCNLLSENPALTSSLREDVQEIEQAATSAASLTRQLLAFSRKQLIEPKVIDANDVLSRMSKMIQRLIGEDLVFEQRLEPALHPIRIDPGQLEQVLVNLAVNARDAMPQGGRLLIETANVELDSEYAQHHLSVTPGTYVMLSVTDTGEGMSREVQAQLFEPFFTTKEVGKGTGLGLATVYGIVKQNDGNIWVYSEPGRGSAFKVYFPALPKTPVHQMAAPKAAARLSGKETILVVEDDKQLRQLARRTLEKQGYTILSAANGDEAVQMSETHPGPIELMVTDVVMPGISGRKLTEAIARARPHIKVLYCSGYTASAIAHHGVIDSGVAFLQKPFTLDSLARKVREVLDGPDDTTDKDK